MSYEVFYRYPGGGNSHYLKTASRRIAHSHLLDILDEDEVRSLASHVVVHYGGRPILDAPASLDSDSILQSVDYPRIGPPRRIQNPVTLAVYIPKKAADFIRARGNGSPSEGLKRILMEVGGDEIARCYRSGE
ncbi:hypothetical protein [Atlantibacter hermannii]|uniref:hypothetical protein n=1 Tax=Atlantibacter hermannii TaxID=565 RepID=UPI00289F140A|nr:hypothetical protein [Atlantibacter hermannii]